MKNTFDIDSFRRIPSQSGFLDVNGPLLYRRDEADRLCLAFMVDPKHANAAGICHGGILTGFADLSMSIAIALGSNPRKMNLTVSFAFEFIAPARKGQTVFLVPRLISASGSLAFAETSGWLENEEILKATGVYTIPRDEVPGYDLSKILASKI